MPDLKGAAAGPLLIRRDTSLSNKEREGLTPRGGGAAGDRDRDVTKTQRSARPPQHQNSRQGPRGEKFVRGGTAMSRAPEAPVIQEQTDVQSVDGGPKTEKGKLFKKLQEEIREGVERADNALLRYEVKTDALDKLEMAAESARPLSPHATPLPDNLDDIIPAAEQMAKERINEGHEEAMRRLVDMYKSLNDEQTGIFASQSTLPDEENVPSLLEEVAAHRKEVISKVQVMRKKAIETAGNTQPVETESQKMLRELQKKEAESYSNAALKELCELHEKKIEDLENELLEENRVREEMITHKDATISFMKERMEQQNEDMQHMLQKTAFDLANSAENVEDTRVHIAYLSIQLRNAKELAASREFDPEKWVLKEDYELLQNELHLSQQMQKKLEERFVTEHQLTKKAYDYAKSVERAMEQAAEVHAKFELDLREAIKARDDDMQRLNYESRLLHARADAMVAELETKRIEMAKQVQEEIDKAQVAMEEQREAFNNLLKAKDEKLAKTEAKVLEMALERDKAEAKAHDLQMVIENMKQEEKTRKLRMTSQPIQLEFQEIHFPLNHSSKQEGGFRPDAACQTSDVKLSLWGVARRKAGITALALLDKRAKALDSAEYALQQIEEDFEQKRQSSEKAILKKLSAVVQREAQVTALAVQLREITAKVRAEKASMDLTADAMKAVESSVDLCVSKLKPLIQASVSQDPSIAEEFLAQDRSKIEGAKVVLQAGKGSDDVAELNALKDSLARIANQADQGEALQRELIDLLHETLSGNTAQQMSSCRLMLKQESELRRRDEIPVLEATLSIVSADKTFEEAKNLPKISRKDIELLEAHSQNEGLLSDVMNRWQRNRMEWLRERKRLRQEVDDAGKASKTEMLKLMGDGSQAGGGRGKVGAVGEADGDSSEIEAMRKEIALYRHTNAALEKAMSGVSSSALEWYSTETGHEYVPLPPPNVDGLPSIVGSAVSLMQACCLTLLGAVDAKAQLDNRPELVSRSNSPMVIDVQDSEQIVYYKEEGGELRSQAPTPVPQGESRLELVERLAAMEAEMAELKDELEKQRPMVEKFKMERGALKMMRNNVEGMSQTLVETAAADKIQEEEAKIERERRMSRSSPGRLKSPQKDDVDAGKKQDESPAGKGVNAPDVHGGKTPDDPLQSVMATMRVQKAASKILRCLRRYRDAKQAKQVGFEDIDVQQLARESARMRTEIESALHKEVDKVHSLQQQLMSLQDQADDLHDMLIQQKSEYEEKLEAAKPPPSKSKNIQTDPWEPPQRGVSPTTVASTVEAARLEVRAKWEGRLKECEARLAEAKAMSDKAVSDLERQMAQVQGELETVRGDLHEAEGQLQEIKLAQRKKGKGMSLESFEGLPLGDLVIAVKKEIQVLHGKARKLERSAKQITEGKEDGEAVDGQATLVADSLMALARKLGAKDAQKGSQIFGDGKMTRARRKQLAMEGTEDDRPRSTDSGEARAAMRLMKLIDADFEDISGPRKEIERTMAGRPKHADAPPVPPLALGQVPSLSLIPPRAAVSERSRQGAKEAWREGDQRQLHPLPPLPVATATLPSLPALPSSRGASREKKPGVRNAESPAWGASRDLSKSPTTTKARRGPRPGYSTVR